MRVLGPLCVMTLPVLQPDRGYRIMMVVLGLSEGPLITQANASLVVPLGEHLCPSQLKELRWNMPVGRDRSVWRRNKEQTSFWGIETFWVLFAYSFELETNMKGRVGLEDDSFLVLRGCSCLPRFLPPRGCRRHSWSLGQAPVGLRTRLSLLSQALCWRTVGQRFLHTLMLNPMEHLDFLAKRTRFLLSVLTML